MAPMIICADDYGLAEDVDAAILELSGSGRLSAVSCIAVLERCSPAALAKLLEHRSRLDVGLHLCLTDERLPLSPAFRLTQRGNSLPSFGVLLRRALCRRIDPAEIEKCIRTQYELFVTKTGRKPDFIDGHLHVHQLPGVAEALLRFVLALPLAERPYVRNTSMRGRELRRRGLPWGKAAFIGRFGVRMRKLASAAGVKTNEGFAGIYDFGQWRHYPEYLPRFVDCLSHPNGMLVVHPGETDDWRRQETQSLRTLSLPAGGLNRFNSPVTQ